ncbi:MAG: cobalamin-binding domain-containing protein [Candidatus Thorarchaeota archaeon]|nr:cobalamin-binding domain-containing protein [Candidatus Thorarchaeota archaeon]
MIYRRKSPKRVLLVEPEYKLKYPPLGLMKISTYHKMRGDEVVFHKGTNASIRDQNWDTIYITTLFTFMWKSTIETIRFYQRNTTNTKDIRVGGILASLLQADVEAETGIRPHFGLWEKVDKLTPDYDLANGMYEYYRNNASFAYMTRGCPNRCSFCAVSKLEPEYVDFIPLRRQLSSNKKDLILLDNNVLASKDFSQIINEIKECGFARGAMYGNAHRVVDFNQGLDARLLTEEKMELLSQLPIDPLRIAFDDIKLKKLYTEKVRLAHRYGLKYLSNYVLFNYRDTPEDLYERLRINIELNAELGLSIFSFPMRYIPLDAKDRTYISTKWNSTQLRGVQCILHATRGVVGPRKPFFERAFGKTADEFKYIIEQPEETIFHRENMKPYQK